MCRQTLKIKTHAGDVHAVASTSSHARVRAAVASQWARKLKKVQDKKLVKLNKSIPRIIFSTKFYFLQFQKWSKISF